MPQTNLNWIINNSHRSAGRAQEKIYIYHPIYHPVYHPGFIYFPLYNQGREKDNNKKTVVLNNSDEL